jgi:hypothetical protein
MKPTMQKCIFYIKLSVFINLVLTECISAEGNFTIDMIKPFELPGVNGQYYRNSDLKGHKLTLIIFLSNHCKVSQSFQKKIIQMNKIWIENQIKLFVFSPNYEKAILPDELAYSDYGDSFEEMKHRAYDESYNFPFIYDGKSQVVTNSLNAKITPIGYLFNKDEKLVYSGKIGNYLRPNDAIKTHLEKNINYLLNGKEVKFNKTKVYGTAIKFQKDMKIAEQVAKRHSQETVNLYYADSKRINFFLNQKTNFPKLFYFWEKRSNLKTVETNLDKICKIFKKFRKRGLKVFTVCICSEEQRNATHLILRNSELSALNYYTNNIDKLDVGKIKLKERQLHFIRLMDNNNLLNYQAIEHVDFTTLNASVLSLLNDQNN